MKKPKMEECLPELDAAIKEIKPILTKHRVVSVIINSKRGAVIIMHPKGELISMDAGGGMWMQEGSMN